MQAFHVLVRHRQRIMWAYIFVVIMLLTAPLPQELEKGAASSFWYAHFALFFFLAIIVEFAHLFSLGKETLAKTLVFALAMELVQLLLPYRTFDIADMAVNISGVVIAYATLAMKKFMTSSST